jgi:hypothetical protein
MLLGRMGRDVQVFVSTDGVTLQLSSLQVIRLKLCVPLTTVWHTLNLLVDMLHAGRLSLGIYYQKAVLCARVGTFSIEV